MRRASLLLLLAGLAGCGGGLESQVAGTWAIDPTSIATPRLMPGAEKKPDWTDAAVALSKVRIRFIARSKQVEASGLGLASKGTWTLRGRTIEVKEVGPGTWPSMIYDPRGSRIHVTMDEGGDSLRMDLVKVAE